MSATVTVSCAWSGCGKQFVAKIADRKRGWAKCCSKSCSAKMREKKIDRFGFQRGESGTFNSRFREQRDPDEEPTFSNAHQFSNEEHDCNKD